MPWVKTVSITAITKLHGRCPIRHRRRAGSPCPHGIGDVSCGASPLPPQKIQQEGAALAHRTRCTFCRDSPLRISESGGCRGSNMACRRTRAPPALPVVHAWVDARVRVHACVRVRACAHWRESMRGYACVWVSGCMFVAMAWFCDVHRWLGVVWHMPRCRHPP